ncbi:hypothetical protein SERLADRAFT_438336 [Serpula lacrymans var. lacrymans S7.9]|uniref:Major facilitator superfamily (MFS) profile domain-containing protein n=1 Tax=Serpula lacrymans var. lacrymans (strain S7.9) TaxID=578457 RepID=F8NXP9_SERL9|nr:uncharacterized protein SERLADRAFT_438336 [Serpula lacrymans var. lacrymans S7.9]EGO24721.1 hypothetical protein SERLADRAFT_438336 [Serpula lacrymans var. lacrymans S7.9]
MAHEADIEIVTFGPNDPEDPRNWPQRRKVGIVAMLCVMSFCAVFGSSSYAPGETQVEKVYGVSEVIASTGLTCVRSAYLVRFFTGCAAACPLNNGTGLSADMFNNDMKKLGKALLYYFCPLSGPVFGTLVGFFVAAKSTGSALWVVRVHFFFSIAVLPLAYMLPETHGPTLLARKAKRLRAEGRNAYAAHEVRKLSKMELIQRHIIRPSVMITCEPIIQGAALWISLAYGIIYFFFEAYPVVFVKQHNFPFILGGLPFLAIPVGMVFVMVFFEPILRFSNSITIPGVTTKGSSLATPEGRLKVVVSACFLMPISLFWFAWTSGPETHWIAPTLSGIPFGYSMYLIFSCFNAYSSQTYTIYASSASSCNVFVRSLIASVLPVLAHYLLDNLGTKWGGMHSCFVSWISELKKGGAVSIFGFLSLGLLPIPLIFIRYGASLRQHSRFAQEALSIVADMQHMRQKQHEGGTTTSTISEEHNQAPLNQGITSTLSEELTQVDNIAENDSVLGVV